MILIILLCYNKSMLYCKHLLFCLVSILTISMAQASDYQKVYVDTSFKSSEEVGLRYYVDNFLSLNTFARPFDQEEMMNKMKTWNPHIKSWKNVTYDTRIFVKQKNPIFEAYVGYNFATNSEDLPSDNEIRIDNQANNFGGSFYYFFSPSIFASADFEINQQWAFTSETAGKTFDYGATSNFSTHFNYLTKRRWGASLGLQKEGITFLSVSDIDNQSSGGILRRLEVAQGNVYWSQLKLTYRTSSNGKGTYYTGTFSKSMFGDKTYETTSKEDDLKGVKLSFDWKQYWLGNYWTKTYYEFRAFDGLVEYTRATVGLNMGYTFW